MAPCVRLTVSSFVRFPLRVDAFSGQQQTETVVVSRSGVIIRVSLVARSDERTRAIPPELERPGQGVETFPFVRAVDEEEEERRGSFHRGNPIFCSTVHFIILNGKEEGGGKEKEGKRWIVITETQRWPDGSKLARLIRRSFNFPARRRLSGTQEAETRPRKMS